MINILLFTLCLSGYYFNSTVKKDSKHLIKENEVSGVNNFIKDIKYSFKPNFVKITTKID